MSFKSIISGVINVVTIGLYIGLALIIFFVLSSKASGGEPQIFGYQLKTVLSGSMEPTFMTGSIIAVKPGGDMTRFKESDIVTYRENRATLVTHRIVEVIEKNGNIMYRTRGDNNDGVDQTLLLPENIVAQYSGFTIPYLGYAIEFTKSKNGVLFLFFIPGLILIIQSIINVRNILVESKSSDQHVANNVEEST
ncbi:signal peptidase I SipW [Sutcliffiella cohnii]